MKKKIIFALIKFFFHFNIFAKIFQFFLNLRRFTFHRLISWVFNPFLWIYSFLSLLFLEFFSQFFPSSLLPLSLLPPSYFAAKKNWFSRQIWINGSRVDPEFATSTEAIHSEGEEEGKTVSRGASILLRKTLINPTKICI